MVTILNIVVQEVCVLLLAPDRDSRQHSLLVMVAALRQEGVKVCVVLVGGNTEIEQEHRRQACRHQCLHEYFKIELHVFKSI